MPCREIFAALRTPSPMAINLCPGLGGGLDILFVSHVLGMIQTCPRARGRICDLSEFWTALGFFESKHTASLVSRMESWVKALVKRA